MSARNSRRGTSESGESIRVTGKNSSMFAQNQKSNITDEILGKSFKTVKLHFWKEFSDLITTSEQKIMLVLVALMAKITNVNQTNITSWSRENGSLDFESEAQKNLVSTTSTGFLQEVEIITTTKTISDSIQVCSIWLN